MELEKDSGVSGMDYQVFLSFRGSDTRQGLADCLYHFMVDAGIRVFRDNEEIHAGERIEEILRMVNNSVVCVPILSKNYASSKWCLRELAKMVECKKEILPIFYNVTPDDVSLKTSTYRRALSAHKKSVLFEKEQWENALKEVARIKGRELKDTGFGEFCKSIVKEVSVKLKVKHKIVTEHLVGLEDHVEALMKLLDIESPDVRFVGIHGPGGIGKTTLAKVVFNQLSPRFAGCSFLEDVRESSRHGLVHLQKHLINNLQSKQRDILDQDEGIKVIRDIVHSRKLLIVLDGVDHSEQIEKLAGKSSSYRSGSRIIVTTRDIRVLAVEGEALGEEGVPQQSRGVRTLEMGEMNSVQALQLLSRHAFGKDSPPPDYLDLSNEVVSAAERLPLSLEIIGSHLHRRSKEEWREKIRRLKKLPHENIQRKLMISYEALDYRTKQIYLDIACFFINKTKTNAIYMWKACNFDPDMGIKELISTSLVKVTDNDKLWMHDHLRDLGREMICLENFMDLGKRSRLWIHEEALGVLKGQEGTRKVQALFLSPDNRLRDSSFTNEEFKHLLNLRFLGLYGLNITGDFENLFSKLRWLSWHCCPSEFMAANLSLENLVILDLSRSHISENWGGWSKIKMGENLKVLDLSSCQKLTRTPDFSNFNALERLVLEDCRRLTTLGSSIAKLTRLKHLNVKGCDSLEGLPEELDSLEALEEIFMRGCSGSFTLPKSIGNLKSLTILEVTRVKIIELPHSITGLATLRRLSLSRCSRVKKLPDSFGDLKSLVELDLSNTEITKLPVSIGKLVKLKLLSLSECSGMEELPDSIGKLKSLMRLNIFRTMITKLPDSIRHLKELKVIEMAGSCIKKLPKAIGQVEKLEELHAKRCKLIGAIPGEVKELCHLKILDLSNTAVSVLPSLNKLSALHTLHLEWCDRLRELPELPSSLISLHVTSLSLQKLPDFSGLNNLINLKLYDATCVSPSSALQPCTFDWIGKLSSLVTLELCLSSVTNLPTDFSAFYQLKRLDLSCSNLPRAPRLPHSLSKLVLGYLQGKKLPNLSHLKNLSYLRLYNCSIEAGFENLGVGMLESLNCFEIICCYFRRFDASNLPENLEKFTIHRCQSLEKLLHLSHLKNLKQLYLSECEKLTEVHGLGEMISLEWLDIVGCHLLESLENLSKLEKLELLSVDDCKKLKDFTGGGRISSMQQLLRNRYLARGTDILFSSGSPSRRVHRKHRRVASS